MKRWALLVVVIVALSVAGCAKNEIALDAADNGKSLSLAVGQVVAITLDSNPTTGYSWEVVGELPPQFEPVGEPQYVADASSKDVVGGGGKLTLRFKIVKAGQASLTLGYLRAWEEKEPEDTFAVFITAK